MTTRDPAKVKRSDLRGALAWITRHPGRVVLASAFFALAGVASALGFLRLQHPYAQWSFAVLCWAVVAIIILARAKTGKQ